jgi:hypothetical protein
MCLSILQIESMDFSSFFQIWRDLILDVSMELVIHSSASCRGKMNDMEEGCWFEGDGSVIIQRLHRWNVADLGLR